MLDEQALGHEGQGPGDGEGGEEVVQEQGKLHADGAVSEPDIDTKMEWSTRQRTREVLASVAVIALLLLWQEVASFSTV